MIRVITVNYKQYKYTASCVRSILASQDADVRVLVIDNGSSQEDHNRLIDLLPETIDIYWSQENIGYINAINYGLKFAIDERAEYVLILNNDAEIDGHAIKNLVASAKQYRDNCIVSGKVYHYDDRTRLQTIGSIYKDKKRLVFKALGRNELDNGQFEQEREVDLLDDIFWLLPMGVIQSTGFYNQLFWFNAEQADYALRARKLGCKLIYTPHAKIWHKGSLSIGGRVSNPVLLYWDAQSNMLLHYLHLSRSVFWSFYTVNLARCLTRTASLIFRGKGRSELRMVFARLWGMLSLWLILISGSNKGQNPYLS